MHRSTRDCFVDNSAIILDTWSCSVCTFLNLATSGTCEMCNTSINGFGGPPQIKKSMASNSYTFERLSLDLSFFQGLPNDISTAIFSLLDLKDILNLYLVCKWFHRELCANDFVWKGLFIKTFSAEPRFVLMEGLDDNMRDIGWRRAFKLQYYLQVTADMRDLMKGSCSYLLHSVFKEVPAQPSLQSMKEDSLYWDKDVGVIEGGALSGSQLSWQGESFVFTPCSCEGKEKEEKPKQHEEEVKEREANGHREDAYNKGHYCGRPAAAVVTNHLEPKRAPTEWDALFEEEEEEEVKQQGYPDNNNNNMKKKKKHLWLRSSQNTLRFCQTVTRCLQPENGYHFSSSSSVFADALARVGHLWTEMDRRTARNLILKMFARAPPFSSPQQSGGLTLPFESFRFRVAEEYVDALFTLFECGRDHGAMRCMCLAAELSQRSGGAEELQQKVKEKEYGGGDDDDYVTTDLLVMGVMLISPCRVVLLLSMYDKLALGLHLDGDKMKRYLKEIHNHELNPESSFDDGDNDGKDEKHQLHPEDWVCSFCTYINCNSTSYRCDMCDLYRSSSRKIH